VKANGMQSAWTLETINLVHSQTQQTHPPHQSVHQNDTFLHLQKTDKTG